MTEITLSQVQATKRFFFAKSAKWQKGVTRLDGAQGTKEVWRPHVRTSFGSKCIVLKKKRGTLLGLFRVPSGSAPEASCPRCYAAGGTLRDKVRSCEIPRALNVGPLHRIDRSQLRWFSHMSRMSHKRLARQVLLAKHTGKWPRDRLRPSWMTTSSTLLGPVLLGSQQNHLKLLLTVRYSKPS